MSPRPRVSPEHLARRLERERKTRYEAEGIAERVTRELYQANLRLAQANRELAELYERQARFIADAAHELRTPVTALVALTGILASDPPASGAELDDRLAMLARQGRRLHELVDKLLDLAAGQGSLEVEIQTVDLAAAVQAALEAVPPPPGTRVETVVPTGVTVMSDQVRLEQVLVNLLGNAYRYGAPPFSLGVQSDDRSLVLVVSDEGPGVDPGVLPRLFEPFARGATSVGEVGSGLGLTLVRRVVEALGGEVWHEANRPRGARFCVRLPNRA